MKTNPFKDWLEKEEEIVKEEIKKESSQWISVDNYLPGMNKKVLIYALPNEQKEGIVTIAVLTKKGWYTETLYAINDMSITY